MGGGWPVGRPLSEEAKRKISEKAKARYAADPDRLARQRALLDRVKPKGEHASALNRARMSTPEARAAISARMKAHWADPARREAHVAASRVGARKASRRQRLSDYRRTFFEGMTPKQRREWIMPAVAASQLANPSGIETTVALTLDALGVSYERQKIIGPITVDFYLPATNTVLEVFGCYWHGCPKCQYVVSPARKRSDRARFHCLKREGFTVLKLWEHAIRHDATAALREVLRL